MSVLVAVLGACGGGGDDPPPTTVGTESAPTTTVVFGDPQGIACLNVATAALALRNDFIRDSRGVVGPPDVEHYRREAVAMRAKHAQLGCPGDLLRDFPDG